MKNPLSLYDIMLLNPGSKHYSIHGQDNCATVTGTPLIKAMTFDTECVSRPVAIRLLGNVSIKVDGIDMAFPYEKSRALFLYLILEHESPLSRTFLSQILWGNMSTPMARQNLRQALHSCRRVISHYFYDLFDVSRESVTFRKSPLIWCDAIEFRQHFTRARSAMKLGDKEMEYQHLLGCCDLYRGTFAEQLPKGISDSYQNWLEALRQSYHFAMCAVIKRLDELTSSKE